VGRGAEASFRKMICSSLVPQKQTSSPLGFTLPPVSRVVAISSPQGDILPLFLGEERSSLAPPATPSRPKVPAERPGALPGGQVCDEANSSPARNVFVPRGFQKK